MIPSDTWEQANRIMVEQSNVAAKHKKNNQLICFLLYTFSRFYLSWYNLGGGNVTNIWHSNEVSKRRHSVWPSCPGVGRGQRGEILQHVVHHAHFGFLLSQRNSYCSSFRGNMKRVIFTVSKSNSKCVSACLFSSYQQGWRAWRRRQQPCRGCSLALWPAARRSEHHTSWWSRGNRWPLRGGEVICSFLPLLLSYFFYQLFSDMVILGWKGYIHRALLPKSQLFYLSSTFIQFLAES